jgi:hypothetical protein
MMSGGHEGANRRDWRLLEFCRPGSEEAWPPPQDKMILHRKTQALVLLPARDLRLDGLELPLQPKHTAAIGRGRLAFPACHGSTQGHTATPALLSIERTLGSLPAAIPTPQAMSLFVPNHTGPVKLSLSGSRADGKVLLTYVSLPHSGCCPAASLQPVQGTRKPSAPP